jgi:hypothetical protein
MQSLAEELRSLADQFETEPEKVGKLLGSLCFEIATTVKMRVDVDIVYSKSRQIYSITLCRHGSDLRGSFLVAKSDFFNMNLPLHVAILRRMNAADAFINREENRA